MGDSVKQKLTKANSRMSVLQQQQPHQHQQLNELPSPATPLHQASLTETSLIEPMDYEAEIRSKKERIDADSLKDMLQFPNDDISVEILPRQIRTEKSTVPASARSQATSLFVKEALNCYSSDWNTVESKYEKYSGSFAKLQRAGLAYSLRRQTFPVDVVQEEEEYNEEVASPIRSDPTTPLLFKSGVLTMPPSQTENQSFMTMKSYKRKWFTLKPDDSTYKLEYNKDEKSTSAPKGSISLTLCSSVNKISVSGKSRKFGFELVMSGDKPTQLLYAENDEEMKDWIRILSQVVERESKDSEESSGETSMGPSRSLSRQESLKSSLRNSMHPELLKYASETDFVNASKRKENRQKLFEVLPELEPSPCLLLNPHANPPLPSEKFNKRILIEFEELKFRINAFMSKNSPLSHVEPFFTSATLYDASKGRKISEEFHFNLNDPAALALISKTPPPLSFLSPIFEEDESNASAESMIKNLKQDFPTFSRKALFSLTFPNPDIYLVIRIEKVLQGGITTSAEPYIKAGPGDNTKAAHKLQKQAKLLCRRLGNYRMPFGWAARPVFKDGEVDSRASFTPIFKQERERLTDEELMQMLSQLKSDKLPKLTVIPGSLRVSITEIQDEIEDVVTPSLVAVKPSIPPSSRKAPPIREVQEFAPLDAYHPHMEYYIHSAFCNHLYVYPVSLKLDSHKGLKARNIACCVQLKDGDDKDSAPLTSIYGKAAGPIFTSSATTTVIYHSSTPTFYEEVKIKLPVQLNDKHHLLFTFYHVAIEPPRGSRHGKLPPVESIVGYSWLKLLDGSKLLRDAVGLPVSTSLPPGYLSVVQFGMGKGFSGPKVEWIDSCKELFRVVTRLVSTVSTQDEPLHHFFWLCDNISNTQPAHDVELCRAIKDLHSITIASLIQFLPVIMNQLLKLLLRESPCAEEVASHSLKALLHFVEQVSKAHRDEVLHTYLKYIFMTQRLSSKKTIHEEMAKNLTKLLRRSGDNAVETFLRHCWFFLEIIAKSMAQHLVLENKITKLRESRFPVDFIISLESLVGAIAVHVWKDHKNTRTKIANRRLAHFVKDCFTYMDRGKVFRLINRYLGPYSSAVERPSGQTYDFAVLSEFKFEFIEIICSHEHFVQLNLPFQLKPGESNLTLTDDFCKRHFLVGLLLQEANAALNDGEAPIRRQVLRVLRNLLAKLEMDDRYESKERKARLSTLFFPFVSIALSHVGRLNMDKSSGSMKESASSYSLASSAQSPASPSDDKSENRPSAFARARSPNDVIARAPANRSSPVGKGTGDIALRLSKMSRLSAIDVKETFEVDETRDLLACVFFILRYVDSGILLEWWNEAMNSVSRIPSSVYTAEKLPDVFLGLMDLIDMLKTSLYVFRYSGLKALRVQLARTDNIRQSIEQASAQGLGSRPAGFRQSIAMLRKASVGSFSLGGLTGGGGGSRSSSSDIETMSKFEGYMANEVSLIVLDLIELLTIEFQGKLESDCGDNIAMRKVFDVLLSFLRLSSSETVLKHVFASLRAFVNKFSASLFQGDSSFCESLCYDVLMMCNSPLKSIRNEASALLYLLLRSNFEFIGSGCVRVHIQSVAALSKMIGSGSIGSSDLNLKRSLATVAQYTDEGMPQEFITEVRDLTRKLGEVLLHTASLKDHETDPEVLVDLQYKLAKNYANSPEQRKAWLESMSFIHIKNQNYSEAAHCHLHVAGLISEYLKRRGEHALGSKQFAPISPNISREEGDIKEDSGMTDTQRYSEHTLIEELETCVSLLDKAERYEVTCDVYQLLLPVYRRNRDFEALAQAYGTLNQACKKVVEVVKSGKRLLGSYFRVAFFGQPFGDDDGKQYIYKEPKVTPLAVISERLEELYSAKLGRVDLIKDSTKVDVEGLDPTAAYIQVTFVEPYFTRAEKIERRTMFERTNNINCFVFETPFTPQGKARGETANQWKRKTILTTSHYFPYVKKRILVVKEDGFDMKPIEVAIDEMERKVIALGQVCAMSRPDMKRLQLLLQGAVMVTVNAGPLEYASVFVAGGRAQNHPQEAVGRLRAIYVEFIRRCGRALELNGRLILQDQVEYQRSLQRDYREMTVRLTKMLEIDPKLVGLRNVAQQARPPQQQQPSSSS